MSANSTRYTGSFDDLDLSDLTGGPAPSGSNPPAAQQPAPPAQPAPQPAQTDDPFEYDEDERRGRGWGKWVIIAAIALAIGVCVWLWVIPAVQTHLNNPSNPDPNPSSSQAPTGSQTPGGNDSQTGDSNGDNDTNQGGQTGAKLTTAEQAAALDPWFEGIPESNWETKTAAQLGVDTTTPLGYFVKNFAVVLSDGTVVARGTSETGDSIPTIISDYTVPAAWNGTALVMAEDDYNAVLVAVNLPEDTNQKIPGAIWRFDVAEGTYVFQFKGHSNPPATE